MKETPLANSSLVILKGPRTSLNGQVSNKRFGSSVANRIVLLGLAWFLAACQFSNHSYVMDQVAALPNGDTISAVSEVNEQLGKPTVNRQYALWRRDGHDKELSLMHSDLQHPTPPPRDGQQPWGELHRSDDGNRVWFVKDGKTTASFDYISATAIVGPVNQPEWAKPQ